MKMTKKLKVQLYTDMVRARKLDQKLVECTASGKLLSSIHSGQGQEAASVGLVSALRREDYLFYQHRGHGTAKLLVKGMTAKEMVAEHFGKATGSARGFSVTHSADMELGIPGKGGMVGGEWTVAAGVGIAAKLRGEKQVVVCNMGDGAVGRGVFHEAMLMAANWKLPLVWYIENNFYQQFTHVSLALPKENVADFAFGYGIPSDIVVDGQNVLDVYKGVVKAVERARSGDGPTLVEVKTYRFRGHIEGFPDTSVRFKGFVRPKKEVEEWKKRDPIKLFEKILLKEGILTKRKIRDIDQLATEEMEEAERFALESPYPDPKDLDKALYAEE